MTGTQGLLAAGITAVIGLIGIWYTRRGQDQVDSGKLALEIAKETRSEIKEIRAEANWLRGALSTYVGHVEQMWQWIADGQPPPPPMRRPMLPPAPPGWVEP